MRNELQNIGTMENVFFDLVWKSGDMTYRQDFNSFDALINEFTVLKDAGVDVKGEVHYKYQDGNKPNWYYIINSLGSVTSKAYPESSASDSVFGNVRHLKRVLKGWHLV